ncbi:MAG: hypothetical protein HY794_03305 [Desulfarculus sp.]|nr:hypothetical protein [Desulfarculus sp.]
MIARLPVIAALACLLCLAGGALAAPTPGAQGLKTPPELQDAVKERNLKAPGKLTGQTPARSLGKMPAPAKARLQKPGPSDGQETPQSFRQRHRLQRGATPGQGSRDVLLNQRIQGQRPTSLQRRPAPPKDQPPAPAGGQPGPEAPPPAQP